MKIGGGFFLWGVITVLFFRWHAEAEAADRAAQHWDALEAELEAMNRQ